MYLNWNKTVVISSVNENSQNQIKIESSCRLCSRDSMNNMCILYRVIISDMRPVTVQTA